MTYNLLVCADGKQLTAIVFSFCTQISARCLNQMEMLCGWSVFYLVKNGDSVKDNKAVDLLSDSADKRNDIMKWYKEMK